MAVNVPIRPGHPERICWGCEHFCPANDMRCGNGTDRAQHPIELWGENWMAIECDETPPEPTDAPESPSAIQGRRCADRDPV